MVLNVFTAFRVVLSLVGIGSGVVAVYGLLKAKTPHGWTQTFLATTAATSLTGFLFPFHGVTPASPGRPLSGRADNHEPFDLSPSSPGDLAADLCHHRRDGALFQHFRAGRPALSPRSGTKGRGADHSEPPFQIAQMVLLLLLTAIGIRTATAKPQRGIVRDS